MIDLSPQDHAALLALVAADKQAAGLAPGLGLGAAVRLEMVGLARTEHQGNGVWVYPTDAGRAFAHRVAS